MKAAFEAEKSTELSLGASIEKSVMLSSEEASEEQLRENLEVKIEENEENAKLDLEASVEEKLSLTDGKEIFQEQVGGTRNYEELDNLPYLDGRLIIGNINERDPTIFAWAKAPQKPVYDMEEVGLETIPLKDLEELFEKM